MPRNKEIPATTRAQIVALSSTGMKQTAIAEQLNTSQQVVSATLKKFRTTGTFSSDRRTGRPRVTTVREDKMIRRLATQHPTWSSREINAEMPSTCTVSTRTIRRRLSSEFELQARTPSRKPLLSKKNVKDRLAFCNKYRHWTPQMWHNVLFTDESAFYQFKCYQQYIRRPRNSRYNARYTIPTVRQSQSIMVWGSISASGPGDLWFMPRNTTMTGLVYLQLLQERLLPLLQRLNCHTLQHDGAPCHRAKCVKDWLAVSEIPTLEWPAQSPDLNPIENAWLLIKKRVAATKPTSLDDLKKKIKEVWQENFSPSECKRLVESMPTRILSVLKNKGYATKY